MKKNETNTKRLFLLIFCSFIFLKSKSSFIELDNFTVVGQLDSYIEKNFAAIVNDLNEPLLKTIEILEKKHNQQVSIVFSNVFAMVYQKSNFDPTVIRNNFFVRQLITLDKSLSFKLILNIADKQKHVTYNDDFSKKNLELISNFINYVSVSQEISVNDLALLFDCKQYLKCYKFLYGDRFNKFMENKPCIVM
jgi:hypothetical protein